MGGWGRHLTLNKYAVVIERGLGDREGGGERETDIPMFEQKIRSNQQTVMDGKWLFSDVKKDKFSIKDARKSFQLKAKQVQKN